MAKFERRERTGRDSKSRSPRRDSGDRSSSRGGFRDRDSRREGPRDRRSSGRDSRFGGRSPRRDLEMTKVTCSECGEKCEVPFKPTSSKPVYCSDCFSKQDKGGRSSGRSSGINLDEVNRKLDKIMKALKI